MRRYVDRITMVRLVHLFLRTEISCLEVDICDPNASCQHEEPLAKCVCNPGYEGDGTTCSPIGASVILTLFFFFFFLSIFYLAPISRASFRVSTDTRSLSSIFFDLLRSSATHTYCLLCTEPALPYKSRKTTTVDPARPVIISSRDIGLACVRFYVARRGID